MLRSLPGGVMGTVADVAAVLAATCNTPKVPTKRVVDWLIKNLGSAWPWPQGPQAPPWPPGLCFLGYEAHE